MLNNFVSYWIKNKKIMWLALTLVGLWWAWGWLFLPKQYNPDIVMPAFQLMIPAPWYTSQEIQRNIIQPLERSLKEIQDIDTTTSIASSNYAATMIMFEVWTSKEAAYTRLIDKLESNKNKIPFGIQNYQITSFDPDDIPIYTIGIMYTWWNSDSMNISQNRTIALDVIEQLKNVTEVGAITLVWWESNNITIEIDPDAVSQQWVDIMQVYEVINKNNIRSMGWKYRADDTVRTLTVDGTIQDIEDIENLIVNNVYDTPVYIKDIATVRYWESDKKDFTLYSDQSWSYYEPVFIGIAKKKWTNAVVVVEKIEKELEKIMKKMPIWYTITAIQNEGETADVATTRLLHELFSSVLVLFVVMLLFMWWKDALSSSLSIPLVLWITFWISLIVGDNVNRITLFALILVLWMLVDDSILVVENISRHLKEKRDHKIETLLPIILDATWEIWWAALFATVTKIVAFLWMFFVSGMMGQYMSPIPKYAIISLSISLVVAFSVNPFFSYIFASTENIIRSQKYPFLKHIIEKYDELKNRILPYYMIFYNKILQIKRLLVDNTWLKNMKPQNNRVDIIGWYEKFISWYLEIWADNKRKFIKKLFWIVLGVSFVTLPALWLFRRRMLPKSNVNQIYIWIDAQSDSSFSATTDLAKTLDTWLYTYNKSYTWELDNNINIIDNISYWVWIAPTSDFSNSFRWSAMRQSENHISMKVNLIPKEDRDLSSEAFVMELRNELQPRLLKNYPWATLRLLEDPPWPPVRSTWMLKVQSDTTTPRSFINTTATWLYKKLQQELYNYDVVDHDISIDRQPQNMDISIDHEAIARAGLSVDQVSHTLYSLFEWVAINTYYNPTAKEALSISIKVKDMYTDYESISFTNPQWEKIPLSAIATMNTNTNNEIQYFDDGKPTTYIYWEMWNNSVIYPMISFLWNATKDSFWGGRFEVVDWSLYEINLREIGTNIDYTVKFWWERELSMDTFKDLWLALALTLFALYIIVSIRFNGFSMGGIIMLPFLFWFIGILPWYSILYLLNNEYFSATSMIGVIALAGISIGNSIILLEYFEELIHKWMNLKDSLVLSWVTRLKPIFLTSITAVIGALMIIGDPVWSWLAWSIIWWLTSSAILTLILIPIFVYDNYMDHK